MRGKRRKQDRAMAEIRTTHLFTLALSVGAPQPVGAGPVGNRRVITVAGGRFEGERLRGTVLEGGSDWIIARPDGTTALDVRMVLQTDDGALIGLTYRGLRHGPPEVMERVNRGEPVDPSSYYFRTAMVFETAAPRYEWLNQIIAIGTGHRTADGPVYEVFEVL
jgi:Protein of unknown function (DUF3237)